MSLLVLHPDLGPRITIASQSDHYDDDDYLAEKRRILAEESRNSLVGQPELVSEEQAANDVLMAAKQEKVGRGFRGSGSCLPARNFMTETEAVRRSNTIKIIDMQL